VVVTEALEAARVERLKACPTQAVAVPDPAVAESVHVEVAQFEMPPVVEGVPDFDPGVNVHPIADVD
jgi:hypothetical protein